MPDELGKHWGCDFKVQEDSQWFVNVWFVATPNYRFPRTMLPT
jgi:hypothetical protein